MTPAGRGDVVQEKHAASSVSSEANNENPSLSHNASSHHHHQRRRGTRRHRQGRRRVRSSRFFSAFNRSAFVSFVGLVVTQLLLFAGILIHHIPDHLIAEHDVLHLPSGAASVVTHQHRQVGIHGNSSVLTNETFVCDGKRSPTSNTYNHRKLLLIVGQERTGTTLVLHMITGLSIAGSEDGLFDVMSAHEFFGTGNSYWKLKGPINVLARECPMILPFNHSNASTTTIANNNDSLREQWVSAFVDNIKNADSSDDNWVDSLPQTPWLNELVQGEREKYRDPKRILSFFQAIPPSSFADKHKGGSNSFVLMKLLENHIRYELQMKTMGMFFDEIILPVWGSSPRTTKSPSHDVMVLVVWRRNFLESFVSLRIAQRKSQWTHGPSDGTDAIRVDPTDLRKYITSWFRYYRDVRNSLRDRGIQYELIEYGRDLSDKSQHLKTMQRLITNVLLGMTTRDHHQPSSSKTLQVAQKATKYLIPKQAQVPVQKQVTNWKELEALGFTKEVPPWDVVFESKEFEWIDKPSPDA